MKNQRSEVSSQRSAVSRALASLLLAALVLAGIAGCATQPEPGPANSAVYPWVGPLVGPDGETL